MVPLQRGQHARRAVTVGILSAFVLSSCPAIAQTAGAPASQDDVAIKTLPPLSAQPPAATPPPQAPAATPVAQAPAGRSNLKFTPAPEPAPSPQQSRFETSSDITPGPSITTDDTSGKAPALVTPAPAETTDPKPIAQSPGLSSKITDPYTRRLPLTTGTVEVRKPFKLFAREELIRNLSFRDTPAKEVIAEVARRGNMNVLIDRSVVGKITGELHDVTLNEAMDNVLAASGLQSRVLDNNTVVIGTMGSFTQLGLNRTQSRVFKLSYAHPYDVANLLYTSFFNRGVIPDFTGNVRRRSANTDKSDNLSGSQEQVATEMKSTGEGGSKRTLLGADKKDSTTTNNDEELRVDENNQINRPDVARTLRGITRGQLQEGIGFNNAATDPGSQQIRQTQETPSDYTVEQNGGGTLVVPDVKNRQVIVVGTMEDILIAEEAINLIDIRPKQIHLQASLVELSNQAIRQLGATVQTQGGGSSAFVLGQQTAANLFPTAQATNPYDATLFARNPAQPAVGPVQPNIQATIAGITSSTAAQSLFNLLSLSRAAGGRINMATFPAAINFSINEILQTNKAKLIASPTVVVVDNTETLITLANEVVHKITTTSNLGVTTTNVELTKAGIFLNVLPKITQDGFITMRLRPQVSTPLGGPQTFGQGNNQTVVTLLAIREIMSQEVRVKDGQTLVLGGLFTENEAANLAKVPYLAEAPILGALFRNSLKGRNRTELLLMITPKLVEEDPPVANVTPSPTM